MISVFPQQSVLCKADGTGGLAIGHNGRNHVRQGKNVHCSDTGSNLNILVVTSKIKLEFANGTIIFGM